MQLSALASKPANIRIREQRIDIKKRAKITYYISLQGLGKILPLTIQGTVMKSIEAGFLINCKFIGAISNDMGYVLQEVPE